MLVGSAAAAPSGGSAAPVHPAVACTGSQIPNAIAGTLTVLGNATPTPSVAGVNLTVGYAYEVAITPSGGSTSYACETSGFVATTDGQGDFFGNISLPAGGCVRGGCTEYYGPYSPGTIRLTDAPPRGYFLNGSLAGTSSNVHLVAALQTLTFVPAGPLTASVNAPTPLRVLGWAANGAPSPATLFGRWSVGGAGWRLANSTGLTNLLTAMTGAGPSSVTVVANATYHGAAITSRSDALEVNAIATTIADASVAPTSLDAGAPATFSVLGTGAEGYNYTAMVLPGFNGSAIVAPCRSTPAPGGAVELACAVRVTYPARGTYQPVVNLTNRYSEAGWPFPDLDVNPALELTATPTVLRGYVGATLGITLARAETTGTGPFGPACLSAGDGNFYCDNSAGPSWGFAPVYARPGNFTATGTLLDAADANASVAIPVTIGARPELGAVDASSQTATPSAPVALSALLSGGIAPYAYWWNDSLPRTTLAAGPLGGPGPVDLDFAASVVGPHTITLTVVDALGTTVATQTTIYVEPPPAALGWLGSPPGHMTAGEPLDVSWIAESANGSRTPQFAQTILVTIAPPAGGADGLSLAAAVPGALEEVANDSYRVNATGWFGGYLNFTITIARAGTYALRLTSPLPVAFAPNGAYDLAVLPDTQALRLVDGRTTVSEGRTNHTLWHLIDPYGNPAPPGSIAVIGAFGGSPLRESVPILTNATAAWAWVNFTAPGTAAGTVTLVTAWNQTLTVFDVPAAPGTDLLTWGSLIGSGAAAGAVLAALLFRRRARRRGGPDGPDGELGPDDLRRYAQGRAALLEKIRTEGPLPMPAILEGEERSASDRAEISEWLASLVTEGQVIAEPGPLGEPFFRAVERAPVTPAPLPRVQVDPTALDRVPPGPGEEGPEVGAVDPFGDDGPDSGVLT